MCPISDKMASLAKLTVGEVNQMRKTAEDPPRISVYDVLQLVTGCPAYNCTTVFERVAKNFPDRFNFDKVQFPGRGQKLTQVCTLQQANELIALLGGRAAAEFRATENGNSRPIKRKNKDKNDDLYIMKYSFDETAVKIGRSENVEKRRRALEACQNFFVEVVAIFPGKGFLESEVHEKLEACHSKKGAGVEWFNICAADAPAICGNILKELTQARAFCRT